VPVLNVLGLIFDVDAQGQKSRALSAISTSPNASTPSPRTVVSPESHPCATRRNAVQPNAIIFHGTGGDPRNCWYPWLGAQLEARGYAVAIPHYPGINRDPLAELLPIVLAGHAFDEETVLVGHSGGAALLLAILERLETRISQAILVAGYMTPPNTNAEPVLQDAYDSEMIKAHVGDLTFINSVNDPYGCNATQGRMMLDHFGGTQIIRDEGHFGDIDDPYPTFELVDRLIR
jgi:predicted alpha/beta hydrolase family esterase